MSQARYRLESLLEFRARLKQQAARLVAANRKQLLEAEAELLRRHQSVLECRARSQAMLASMFDAAVRGIEACRLLEFRTHVADLRRMERDLIAAEEQQKTSVLRAESDLDKAIASLSEAHEQSKIIEKHRESWRARVRREEDRREQRLNDEAGNVLYERQRHQLKS